MTKSGWLFCCNALPASAWAQDLGLPNAMPTTIWFVLLMLAFVAILGIGFSVQLWRDAQERKLDEQLSLPREEFDAIPKNRSTKPKR